MPPFNLASLNILKKLVTSKQLGLTPDVLYYLLRYATWCWMLTLNITIIFSIFDEVVWLFSSRDEDQSITGLEFTLVIKIVDEILSLPGSFAMNYLHMQITFNYF